MDFSKNLITLLFLKLLITVPIFKIINYFLYFFPAKRNFSFCMPKFASLFYM
jgi:hypothetical protein